MKKKIIEPKGLFDQIMDMTRLTWCMQSLEVLENTSPKSKLTKDLKKVVKELKKKVLE